MPKPNSLNSMIFLNFPRVEHYRSRRRKRSFAGGKLALGFDSAIDSLVASSRAPDLLFERNEPTLLGVAGRSFR
jgi:hypothetical protein